MAAVRRSPRKADKARESESSRQTSSAAAAPSTGPQTVAAYPEPPPDVSSLPTAPVHILNTKFESRSCSNVKPGVLADSWRAGPSAKLLQALHLLSADTIKPYAFSPIGDVFLRHLATGYGIPLPSNLAAVVDAHPHSNLTKKRKAGNEQELVLPIEVSLEWIEPENVSIIREPIRLGIGREVMWVRAPIPEAQARAVEQRVLEERLDRNLAQTRLNAVLEVIFEYLTSAAERGKSGANHDELAKAADRALRFFTLANFYAEFCRSPSNACSAVKAAVLKGITPGSDEWHDTRQGLVEQFLKSADDHAAQPPKLFTWERSGSDDDSASDLHSPHRAFLQLGCFVLDHAVPEPISYVNGDMLKRSWISIDGTATVYEPLVSPKAFGAVAADYINSVATSDKNLITQQAKAFESRHNNKLLDLSIDLRVHLEPSAFQYGTRPLDGPFVAPAAGKSNGLATAIPSTTASAIGLLLRACLEVPAPLIKVAPQPDSYWAPTARAFHKLPEEPQRVVPLLPDVKKTSRLKQQKSKKKGSSKTTADAVLVASTAQDEEKDDASADPGDLPFDNSTKTLLEACRPAADSPQHEPPLGSLHSALLPFQKKALAWMLSREKDATEECTFPGWVAIQSAQSQRDTASGESAEKKIKLEGQATGSFDENFRFYLEEVTGVLSTRRYTAPPLQPGGLLAEQMGLGKTVEMLALIASNPRTPDYVDRSRSFQLAQELAEDERPLQSTATLVIVPAAIAAQWMMEINKHWAGPAEKVIKATAEMVAWTVSTARQTIRERCKPFLDADIVVVTYELLTAQLRLCKKVTFGPASPRSPLLEVMWHRVIVDEAQMISSSNGAAALICNELYRTNGWVSTGTCFNSSVADLHGLLVFLDHDPLASPRHFKTLLEAPFNEGDEIGIHRMRALLQKVMWRHTKQHVRDELDLPPNETVWLDLDITGLEQTLYKKAVEQSRARFIKSVCARRTPDLAFVTMLRQLVSHPQLADSFGSPIRLTFVQLFDRLLTRKSNALRARRLRLCTSVLQLVFGAQFYAERKSAAKWKGGEPPSSAQLKLLIKWALELAKGVDEVQESASSTAEDDTASQPAHLTQDGGFSNDNASTRDQEEEEAGPSTSKQEASQPAMQAATEPARSARSTHDMTFEEAQYWLELALGRNPAAPPRFNPERPSLLFYEKIYREAKPGDERDPDFHLIDRDAGFEEEAEKGEDGVAIMKNRLRGGAQGRTAQMGWSYKPRTKLDRIYKDVLEERVHLEHDTREVRYLRSRRAEATGSAREGQGNVCPVCFERGDEKPFLRFGVIARCHHAFCTECLEQLLSSKAPSKCPTCRHDFTRKDILELMGEGELDAAPSAHGDQEQAVKGDYGAKIQGLVRDFGARLRSDPTINAVIFSHWHKMLTYVHEALLENGFQAALFTGHEEQRGAALHALQAANGGFLLLVPMRSDQGAAGLTLTSATISYILEPSLDPGLEAQAMARVWRFGQRRPTTTVRVRMANTIEPEIVDIAARKGESDVAEGGTDRDGITLEDLARILDVDIEKERRDHGLRRDER